MRYASWVEKGKTTDVLYSLVTDDMEFEATDLLYDTTLVTFSYLKRIGPGRVGYGAYGTAVIPETDPTTLLVNIPDLGDIAEHYKFIGFDKEFEPVPRTESAAEGPVYRAVYEKTEFDVTVNIPPLKGIDGEELYDGTPVKIKAKWGEPIWLLGNVPGIEGYNITRDDGPIEGIICEGPTTIEAHYEILTDLKVNVYTDYKQEELLASRENITYGSNVRDILEDEAITEYLKKFPYSYYNSQNQLLTVEFVGIACEDKLEKLTMSRDIYLLFSTTFDGFRYCTAKFDPMDGSIPSGFGYFKEDGYEIRYGDAIDQEILDMITPTQISDNEDYRFEFEGWCDNKELEGNVVTDFTLTEDKVFYARYKRQIKTYDLTVHADGVCYDAETAQETAIEGSFPDGTKIRTFQGLTKFEVKEKIRQIRSGGLENEYPEAEGYYFSDYSTSSFPDSVELIPIYRKNPETVSMIFHMGEGQYEGKKGTCTTAVSGGPVLMNLSEFFTPSEDEFVWKYDEETEQLVQVFCCYQDESYYYLPKKPMCWSYDGVNPIPEKDYEIDLEKTDQTLFEFTALYEAYPKSVLLEFQVDYRAGARFDGEASSSTYVAFYGDYGSSFSVQQLPAVTMQAPPYSDYEYVFDYWLCEKTGECIRAEDIISFLGFPEENMAGVRKQVFIAQFRRQYKNLTLTLDAGEDGYFESTGSRYRYLTIKAGDKVEDFGELPISRTQGVVFDSWSYYAGGVFHTDCTIEAYYE